MSIGQSNINVGGLLWQRKNKCASFADFGFHRDTATVNLNDLFHNRKPDAGVPDLFTL